MRRLTIAEVEALRRAPGRSALLFLTDRCPVGCAHCSVEALRQGPGIRDWDLFVDLVNALCGLDDLEVVGVSGGEPFAERRGLSYAAGKLTAAGRLIVPYTSGYWGTAGEPPGWIREVIRRSSCVVLSTDRHHSERLADAVVVGAARAIAAADVWIACQVIDESRQLDAAVALLTSAFGTGWPDYAELAPIPLLPYGRAAGLPATTAGARPDGPVGAGRCPLARSPVIRYDGRITACCNEVVVMGGGPAGLHRRAADGAALTDAVTGLARAPYFTAIATVGVPALTALPAYRDVTCRTSGEICRTCWQLLDRGADRDPLVRALASLGGAG